MSSNGSDQSPNSDLGSGLGKLLHLDPVLVTAAVTVVTGIAAIFGVELTSGKSQMYGVGLLVVFVVGAQLWARRKTLAKKKVVSYLPNPVERPAALAAGEAVTTARDGLVLMAARTSGGDR